MKPFIWLVPHGVRPNHITIFRMILTPFVLGFLFFEDYTIGVPLFLFASATDALDGSLARIRNQVTAWGTFYDPVADKLLIGSVLVLIVIQHINPIIAAAILALEGMIILGGWYRRHEGEIGHANVWGKIKMFLETLALLFLLISLWSGVDLFVQLSNGTLLLAVVFALVALLTYSL